VIRTVDSWRARAVRCGSVRGNGSARLEVLVPVPIGAAVAVTVALLHSPAVGLLLGWDTVAVLYICWLAFVLLRGVHGVSTSELLQVGFGLVSVVVSWALVHPLFTLRYAAHYYGRPGGGIDFNSAEPPRYRISPTWPSPGMTFEVSDTVLPATALRGAVLRHALLSYLFGTGILAGRGSTSSPACAAASPVPC
jgi:uncharacterized membrane protein